MVGLMVTWFTEKMLIFNICRLGLMPNLIKKSWTVSTLSYFLALIHLLPSWLVWVEIKLFYPNRLLTSSNQFNKAEIDAKSLLYKYIYCVLNKWKRKWFISFFNASISNPFHRKAGNVCPSSNWVWKIILNSILYLLSHVLNFLKLTTFCHIFVAFS